jgi:hypothetical protein
MKNFYVPRDEDDNMVVLSEVGDLSVDIIELSKEEKEQVKKSINESNKN